MREGMKFSRITAVGLFMYYAALFVVGGFAFVSLLLEGGLERTATLASSLYLASVIGLAVGAIFYARKLYHDLFSFDGSVPVPTHGLMATTAYFAFRPAFSILAANLVALSSYGFIHAVTVHGTVLSEGFLIFISISSALTGAATGHAVDRIDALAEEAAKAIKGAA